MLTAQPRLAFFNSLLDGSGAIWSLRKTLMDNAVRKSALSLEYDPRSLNSDPRGFLKQA
jgi:hypothetical protein